ncbi:hypothetical protein SAMN05192529_13138 [Arachidicoccus rhizosphaerae]|uniref:Uncharacterized protein n=2 Tax=Arachidicoccus rhizosphaerae TaxID=551991 RepID=A0A1H4CH09_9BACT|nr:hypothetical protein SAMN05192529_13138 [Arachidicoccus rhizosphaerae]
MTAQQILKKHLGSPQLGPVTFTKVEAAMFEYADLEHLAGITAGQADAETWKRLADAKEAKIRELEQRLEDIKEGGKMNKLIIFLSTIVIMAKLFFGHASEINKIGCCICLLILCCTSMIINEIKNNR